MATSHESNGKAMHEQRTLVQVDTTDVHMSGGRYAATRLTTLRPPMAKAPNPFRLLRMLGDWRYRRDGGYGYGWDRGYDRPYWNQW